MNQTMVSPSQGTRAGGGFRDVAIDVIRGMCLVSMATGHIIWPTGSESLINDLIHLPLLVDGASGFVFLSGVSIALADQGRIRRGESHRQRVRWLLLRAAFIYAIHIVLTLSALLLFSVARWPEWAGPSEIDGRTLAEILTFGRVVSYVDILPMYVVFLLATSLLIRSSTTRALKAISALSAIIYLGSLLRPELTGLRSANDHEVVWVLGTWQVLFFGGFVMGSRWSELRARLGGQWRRRAIVVGCASLLFLLTVRSMYVVFAIVNFGATATWKDRIQNELFSKSLLPLPSLAITVGFGVGVYMLVTELLRRWPRALLPLATIGARSLRVYLASCVSVIVAGASIPSVPGAVQAELLAIAALVGCLLVSRFRPVGKGEPWSF